MNRMIPYSIRRNPIASPMYLFDDDFFRPFFGAPVMRENFRVSVKDSGDRYELEAEMPGVAKDAISIDADHGVLTISAEWTQENDTNEGYVLNERRYGKMQRTFNIEGVDESAITAAYTDGILRLTLPKKAEVNTARRIEIQ